MESTRPRSEPDRGRRLAWAVLPPLAAAAILFAVTELPYAAHRRATPPGFAFDGVIAYVEDLHAYFSFARQGFEGRWLFENRFAPEEHAPAFFNLEWLLVGRATRLFGDPGVFVAWRAAGIALLVFGFWAVTASLGRRSHRLLAMAIFAFGGGLGWIAASARGLGFPAAAPSGASADFLEADQEWGVQPFVQALQNPHFTVAHGLVLLSLALLVHAERTSRAIAYVGAGALALVACLCRPYELLAFLAAVPLLQLASGAARDGRSAARRALALVLLLPAFLPLWVIWREPSFQPWQSQGVMPVVPLHAYAILLGVPALVLAVRVALERRIRLGDPAERVMWVWCIAVLCLSQANRFTDAIPYSPQILVTSLGPIVVLAMPALTRRPAWIVAVVVLLALPSSAIVLVKRWREAGSSLPHYVSDGERAAWEWLAGRVEPSDVVLATTPSSVRLPRHVPAHVVAGHWTLSPEYERRDAETLAFFQGNLGPDGSAAFLRRFGVDWIWVGPWENALGGWRKDGFAPGCEPCYEKLGVRLYRCAD